MEVEFDLDAHLETPLIDLNIEDEVEPIRLPSHFDDLTSEAPYGWVALAKSTCVPLAFASVHAQSLARDRVEDIPERNHKTATMIGQSRERVEGTGIALQNGDGRKTNSPKTDQTLSRTWGFPRTDVFLLPTHASTDQ